MYNIMHIVGKDYIYLSVLERGRKASHCKLFWPVFQRVQINFHFNDNVCVLCLSCNVKESKTAVTFRGSELFFEVKFQF